MANPRKKEKTPGVVPAELYTSLFQNHPDGQRILDELAAKFYDRTSVGNPVDPNATLVMEGQRQVILFIIAKCAEGQK